jgi:Tol biopolymer transport system component
VPGCKRMMVVALVALACGAEVAATAAKPPAHWRQCDSACPGERSPVFLPSGSILFWGSPSKTAPGGQLWRVRADGRKLHKVAAEGASIFVASPVGNRIALGDNGFGEGVGVVNLVTGKVVHLPAGGASFASASVATNPAWSKDGSKIAYQVLIDPRGGNVCCEIWASNVDGTDNHKLGDGGSPVWLADGRVVFAAGGTGQSRGLQIVNGDGTGLKMLTPPSSLDAWPAPSPDGARIAFYRATPPQGRAQLWVVNSDGSAANQLTHEPLGVFTPLGVSTFRSAGQGPQWAPDGLRIAFFAGGTNGPQLRVIRLAGGEGLLAAGVSVRARPSLTRFAWSPAGTSLVYLGGGATSPRVCPFTVQLATARSRPLPCP